MSALLSGIITAQTGASKVFAPSYPRYSALMNGIRYITANETVLNGPFEIELTWERRDQELDGTGVTWLLGNTDEGDTRDRIVAYDSNHPTQANRLLIFTDAGEVGASVDGFFDGVAQGQFVTIKITLNDNQIDFYLDGELKGTRFDNDARIVPFSITELGAARGGNNASRGIPADVKIVDHSKLPKGTYLSDQAGTYTDVSIPVIVGDVLTLDYLYRADTGIQGIFGTANKASPLRVEPDGLLGFSLSFNSEVKVNGNVVASDVFQMVEGETYAIQTTIAEIDTISKIGANNTGGLRNEGVIANFNLNNGETVFRFDDVIDNGDNTGVAPQTGTSSVADGFIPSFDPLIDQYTAEPNTVYWPIDEASGVDVLAYDENGDRWEHDLWREQGLIYDAGASRLGMNDYEFNDSPQFNAIRNNIESLPDGTQLVVTFEIYDYVQGFIDVVIRSDSAQVISLKRSANGIYTESLIVAAASVAAPLQVLLRGNAGIGTTCKVRNVSMIVKKDGVFTPDADREFQSSFIGAGSVLVKDSIDSPTQYINGVPCDRNGVLAVDSVGALVIKQVSALPMTVNGRIAVVTDSAVERIGSGATPINQGRLVLGTGSPTRYSSGVPYTADSQIAVILK
jgi:hypothetical protein